MSSKPLPYRKRRKSLRERIRPRVKTALTDKPGEEVKAEWYEEFASELAAVQRGMTRVQPAIDAIARVRDKWLRRGLHWPTVARIMGHIVSLPFEMNPKTGD